MKVLGNVEHDYGKLGHGPGHVHVPAAAKTGASGSRNSGCVGHRHVTASKIRRSPGIPPAVQPAMQGPSHPAPAPMSRMLAPTPRGDKIAAPSSVRMAFRNSGKSLGRSWKSKNGTDRPGREARNRESPDHPRCSPMMPAPSASTISAFLASLLQCRGRALCPCSLEDRCP